ncbi:MerR family transcriptional regulator [Phreatobacter sp. AB_2022a]|uniref:MerR family transcriptional regulator n=1 Tax=Phreatobacter sp. AB_2022a TaxID=3003134 RepID=UPI0022872CAB|nr:MerR family transcriptional regulator [Phreatobacter sp. AB_2022a]
MDKAPDAYRTISEVAEDLDLPQHVLRFWETRFAQIRPLKRGGGRRYYRPEDIDLLKGIRHLLYGEGYTIRGVQRIIKENGVKSIQALGRGEGGAALPKPGGPEVVAPDHGEEAGADRDHHDRVPEDRPAPGGLRASLKGLIPGLRGEAADHGGAPYERTEPGFAEDDGEPGSGMDRGEDEADAAETAGQRDFAPPQRSGAPTRTMSEPSPPWAAAGSAPRQGISRVETGGPGPVGGPPRPAPVRQLATDDIRRLQAALNELTECRRRLDQAFAAR